MEAILTPSSPLGKLLHQFSHSDKIPTEFTTRQIVAALLLRRDSRTGILEQILGNFVHLPSNKEEWDNSKLVVIDKRFAHPYEMYDEKAPVVARTRVIAEFLDREKVKYFREFPQKEALAPKDPAACEAWLENKFLTVAAQEGDLDGSEADIDYSDDAWMDMIEPYKGEAVSRPSVYNFTLAPSKENCYFAEFLPGWQDGASRTFSGWKDIPKELKVMILKDAFSFDGTIEVSYNIARVGPMIHTPELNIARVGREIHVPEHGPHSKTCANQSANLHFSFGLLLRALPALNPLQGGHEYQDMGGALQVIRGDKSCKLGREFRGLAREAFLGQNFFKIEDINRRHRFGTHRWLELAQKRNYLHWIRALELDLNIGAQGQTKYHLRRIALSVLTMPVLRRLVINTDMEWTWDDELYLNPDVGFIYQNVAYMATQWPLLRMLIWARKELNILIPGVRKMESIFMELKKLKEDDPRKFWVPGDWQEPPEGFSSVDVAKKVAEIVSNQLPTQKLALVESREDYKKYHTGLIPQDGSGGGGEAGYDHTEHGAQRAYDFAMEVVEEEGADFDMVDSDAELDVGLDEDEEMNEDTEANESVDDD